jgi:hypothetical protein
MLSDSARAPEYSARLPTGNATVDVGCVGRPLALGTQNSARFPKGSGTGVPLKLAITMLAWHR